MTWHTPFGDRYLIGDEADLVRRSLAIMLEELTSCRETGEDPVLYGVTLFDELAWQQQLALLEQLAQHLFCETPDTIELTGVVDASVSAVYLNIAQQIEMEIELHGVSPDEYRCLWRQASLDAMHDWPEEETSEDESLLQLTASCIDFVRWHELVDLLADRVLWDRDFELVHEVIDAPPERAAAMRAALGIESSYYTAIAPDPPDQQVDQLFDSLESLTRAKPK
ncbi:MAG: hypothetical protein AAFX06_00640 [Planctomycetota bacterium]